MYQGRIQNFNLGGRRELSGQRGRRLGRGNSHSPAFVENFIDKDVASRGEVSGGERKGFPSQTD